MKTLEFDENFSYENLRKSQSERILGHYVDVDLLKSYIISKGKEESKAKVKRVMDEWKAGELKSRSGQKVTDQKQAIAIALHQAGLSKAEATGKELDELIEEHKNLINVLQSPSHEDDKKEAEKQSKELDEYEGEVKKGGEGSRGGKVIGHTKSGNPIYEHSGIKVGEHYNHSNHFLIGGKESQSINSFKEGIKNNNIKKAYETLGIITNK